MKYLNRGWFLACSTATGCTCSATRPARPSCRAIRNVPTHCWRRPTVAARIEIGSIRLQQIGGTDIRLEALADQGDHVHQRFRWLAALRREISNFFQRQNKTGDSWFCDRQHLRKLVLVRVHSRARLRHQGPLGPDFPLTNPERLLSLRREGMSNRQYLSAR